LARCPTVASRSIPIRLERKTDKDTVQCSTISLSAQRGKAVRSHIKKWAAEHKAALSGARPDMPDAHWVTGHARVREPKENRNPCSLEGGEVQTLEMSTNKNPFQQAGFALTVLQTNEEPIEVNSVA
jgi:hypothetical protein